MKLKHIICLILVLTLPAILFGGTGIDNTKNIGVLAEDVTKSLGGVMQLIVGIATVAGLGFGVAAIFKFKQHRDNPTQVPLGQPLALLAIAVGFLWLQYILQSAGQTLTGNEAEKGQSKVKETPGWLENQ